MSNQDRWADGICNIRDNVMEILKYRGYETYDLDALAKAESFDELPMVYRPSELHKFAAPRPPPAEIVTAARYVLVAAMCLDAIEDDELDIVAMSSYQLGQLIVEFTSYVKAPGHFVSGDQAGDLPSLFAEMDKFATAEFERQRSAVIGRRRQLEKEKEDRRPRNDALCDKGRDLKSEGCTDIHLARDVWLNWERNDTWAKYPGTKHLRNAKQVRKILRDGGVLPPLNKKDGK